VTSTNTRQANSAADAICISLVTKWNTYVIKESGGKNWEYRETSIHLQPFAFVSLVNHHPEVTGRGVQLLVKTRHMIHQELVYENSYSSSGGQEIGPLM
jgi:hypothetical protein